jgi:signal transduction histidine kinase
VFKEFQKITTTANQAQLGMGLGLSLVKRLVALHGGKISFVSTPGTGSVFSVQLPKSFDTKEK